MLGGAAIGAGTRAVAGHMVGGMKWSDLRDLGECSTGPPSLAKCIRRVTAGRSMGVRRFDAQE
jgi:hypothetical protein